MPPLFPPFGWRYFSISSASVSFQRTSRNLIKWTEFGQRASSVFICVFNVEHNWALFSLHINFDRYFWIQSVKYYRETSKLTWQRFTWWLVWFCRSFGPKLEPTGDKYQNSSTSISEKRLLSRNSADIRQRCFHLLCAVWLVNLLEQLMPMGFPPAHRSSTDGSLRLNLTLQTMENSRK